MRDALDVMFLIGALLVGFCIGGCVCNTAWEKTSVKAGKAEFFLDENNNKQWRWK